MNSTILTNSEITVLRYTFLFLLKFFSAKVSSRPKSLATSLDVFTFWGLILISVVWRMASIADSRAAFRAGI